MIKNFFIYDIYKKKYFLTGLILMIIAFYGSIVTLCITLGRDEKQRDYNQEATLGKREPYVKELDSEVQETAIQSEIETIQPAEQGEEGDVPIDNPSEENALPFNMPIDLNSNIITDDNELLFEAEVQQFDSEQIEDVSVGISLWVADMKTGENAILMNGDLDGVKLGDIYSVFLNKKLAGYFRVEQIFEHFSLGQMFDYNKKDFPDNISFLQAYLIRDNSGQIKELKGFNHN